MDGVESGNRGSGPTDNFLVEPSLRMGPKPDAAPRSYGERSGPSAVLVVHGVGQQTKFETLDMLVRGLVRGARSEVAGAPRARLVSLAGEPLHRVEITLQTEGGAREVHLYEAYWAPLTEGRVKLRDVIHLVFLAIVNGVSNGITAFRRWMFGRYEDFPPQIRTVAYLLVGLVAVLSLVVINATIGLVASARWGLSVSQTVVGDEGTKLV